MSASSSFEEPELLVSALAPLASEAVELLIDNANPTIANHNKSYLFARLVAKERGLELSALPGRWHE